MPTSRSSVALSAGRVQYDVVFNDAAHVPDGADQLRPGLAARAVRRRRGADMERLEPVAGQILRELHAVLQGLPGARAVEAGRENGCQHCKPSAQLRHLAGPAGILPGILLPLHLDRLNLGPEWKPDTCKFVMNDIRRMGTFAISTDPGHRTAWRNEPYYSRLKKRCPVSSSKTASPRYVDDHTHLTIVTPDEDAIVGRSRETPNYEIFKDVIPAWRATASFVKDGPQAA